MKKCCSCLVTKNLTCFRKDKHNLDGFDYNCKDCKSIKEKNRSQLKPEIRKNINDRWKEKRTKYYSSEDKKRKYKDLELQRSFGITLIEYEEMLDKQDNVCYICKGEETSIRNRRLAVDHNHSTGKIRGLLCSNCNRALGLFKDSKELLLAAANYLELKDEA